ncbi:hypothetical protein P245_15420 [Comamonas thiooxydans]|uniref:Uncharacterized protein n=1 Tax=Comamonas thiooxydans TaxID=363952 RepID=A0A0E3BJE7_9BURK|nr:hypothetical protein [Comamonas thiooxydans]KGG90839.1 hypothetical protein P245_15420 [Comamonas thiooxydans]
MQDKNFIKLTDQDAALLEQGASMLEGLENDERNRGNCSTAEGAGCSAHAVRRLASALLAHEREIDQCLHQIQEPAAAEQSAWHAGLDEGRAQAAPAAVAVPDGWKLVPTEPTPQMCHVGRYGGDKDAPAYGEKPVEGETAWPFVADHTAKQIYCAMLAAAPALAATPACDTPNYCRSVQRCTAMDGQRAAAAPVVLPEPMAWMATPVMQSGRGTTTVFCSDKRMADQWDYGGHPEYGRMLVTRLFTEQQLRALLATAPLQPVEVPTKDQATWCSYIAGMIGCYLNEPDDSPRVKAIAGIIERRLWALPSAATATGLPAHAVADEVHCVCGASWLRHGVNNYEMTDTPRKAQADARDALIPAKPVHPKGMTSINARLSFNMGWMACERHHGIRAEDVEQAVATDAAIAAAKGE